MATLFRRSWPAAFGLLFLVFGASACAGGIDVALGDDVARPLLGAELETVLSAGTGGVDSFAMPTSLTEIPADPGNPLTAAKVDLGRALFHDTALAVAGMDASLAGTYSCASCHQVAAGFKAGIDQGIGEGGDGFDTARSLIGGFDRPDVQPVASPTVLNTAFQDVMLWNGQFGNGEGSVNRSVDAGALLTDDTPKAVNALGFEGLETQAIAGLGVHRLDVEDNPLLATDAYLELFAAAFPDAAGAPTQQQAGLAIAAYERTLLATEAPFQRWLRGESEAMSVAELRGALVFFGPAGCSACHTGPALSSATDSTTSSDLFQNVGFADLDDPGRAGPMFLGTITGADRLGRGGLTGDPVDSYAFKVPQLYNLADGDAFGHGSSFDTIAEVVDYFIAAEPQNAATEWSLDERFAPLDLTVQQRSDLLAFLTTGLHDPDLERYVPPGWPLQPVVVATTATVGG